MLSRLLTLMVAAATMIGLTIVAAPAASADPFGDCDSTSGCLPDNFEHTYCWDSTYTSAFYNAAKYSMTNLDSQSSYYDTYMSSCTNATDVRFQKTTAFSARGDYVCLAFNGAGNCERSRVRLNPDYLTNTANRQKTACHEVGHSGGLAHSSSASDCMISGAITSGYQTYNSHHRTHLNDRS